MQKTVLFPKIFIKKNTQKGNKQVVCSLRFFKIPLCLCPSTAVCNNASQVLYLFANKVYYLTKSSGVFTKPNTRGGKIIGLVQSLPFFVVAGFLEAHFLVQNSSVLAKSNTRGCIFAVFVAIYLSFACVFCPDLGASCQKECV